jgi:hypothetical protein
MFSIIILSGDFSRLLWLPFFNGTEGSESHGMSSEDLFPTPFVKPHFVFRGVKIHIA